MAEQSCGNCKFIGTKHWITAVGLISQGEFYVCRLNPPVFILDDNNGVWEFPMTHPGLWCGQWQENIEPFESLDEISGVPEI